MSKKKLTELIVALKGGESFEKLSANLKSFGVDVSVSSLQKYVSIVDARFPSIETLEGLYQYAKQKKIDVPTIEEISFFPKEVLDFVYIPIVISVPPVGSILVRENIEGAMPIHNDFLSDTEDMVCMKVRGVSMLDMGICDGDFLFIYVHDTAKNGQTVIARVNDEVICKRIYLIDDKVIFEPLNGKYKDLKVQEVEIVGVVTRIMKVISV